MRLFLVLAVVVIVLVVLLYVRHAKTVRKVIGTIVGAILFIIFLVFGLTSSLPKVADNMFDAVKAGNIEAAYAQTAKAFQSATTVEQFKAFLTQSTLDKYQKASWTDREILNNQGVLKGTVTTTDGGKVPVEVDLIKEDGKRTIYTLFIPQGGIIDTTDTTDTTSSAVPSQADTTTMVNTVMGRFANAVSKGDFTSFYANISDAWKPQITVAQFNEAFKSLIDAKVDLSFTKTNAPTFAAVPTIDANGILDVQGEFPATDGRVIFDQKFIKENGTRKLFGIEVRTAK